MGDDKSIAAAAHTAGVEQWLALSEQLLAGLVHALNNRVTALSVCAELAGMGDEKMVSGGILSTETQRLLRAGALIGLLPARERPAEALELAPVLDDAIAMHAHHPQARDTECVVEVDGAQPVRAPRWALLRLLLIIVDEAKAAAAQSAPRRAVIRLEGAGARMTVRAATAGDGGAYGAAMAARCSAQLSNDGGELVAAFPTLGALRERERTARTAD